MKNPVLVAHLALFTVALIYGLNYSIAKEVMPEFLQPQAFIFLRVVGASFLFWLFTSFRKFERIQWRDFPPLATCGLFGVALNQMLFFEGLNMTTPINASIIMVTTPMLVMVMAAIIQKEPLTSTKIIGLLLGAGGAVYLISTNNPLATFSTKGSLGDGLVFLNAASFALYLVLAKPLMQKYKPLTVINWVFFFGTIIAIPFGWQEVQSANFDTFPNVVWYKIAFVIIGVTFLTYLFNTFALRWVSSTVVSSYIYLQPLLAAAIAIALGSDAITWPKITSALLIFSGVYLVAFYKR